MSEPTKGLPTDAELRAIVAKKPAVWWAEASDIAAEILRLRAELAKASAEVKKPAPFSQCSDGWGYAISSIGWDDFDCPSRISVTRTDGNGRTQVLDFVEPNRFLAGKKPHQFTGAEALAPSYEASQAAKVEEQAVALMRRARARDAEVRALVAKDKAAFLRLFDQDVEVEADRAMIEKASKCLSRVCADQGFKLSACIPARPGVDDDLVIADGLEAGMRAVRRARATGSLERLRERVEKAQAEIEANAKNFDTMATAGYGLQVLKWIDEERGAGR